MKYRCCCCNFKSLIQNPKDPTFEICPICYWENDPYQNENPDYIGGVNLLCLNSAKLNFKKYHTVEERFKDIVRSPLPDEY